VSGFLVGTAGHVDHGKTALLAALTGIDCDRLPEEKRRGITLDLGFAHLERDGAEIGFVDVPGHERFLHNALAGLGGLRLLLLVVAADEGVRPQTREHLSIAGLLGIPAAIVALSKIDLVDVATREIAELEIAELLAPTRFAGAPLYPVSSVTGEGVAALAAALVERAREAAPLPGLADPARLPIDRAFSPRGQGVVVTGTLTHGRVRAGDELRLLPEGKPVRVRAVQVHGRPREEVEAGSRVALQLGGVELGQVARGQELAAAGGAEASRALLVRLHLLPDAPFAITGAVEVRLHVDAAEAPARLRLLDPERLAPGESGLVVIRCRAPLVAVRGDRCVVRRLSPAATLGGGEVLDPRWRRPRRIELARHLAALAGDDDAAAIAWAEAGAEGGLTAAELARRGGRGVAEARARLERLAKSGRLLAGVERFFAPAPLAELEVRARALLDAYFAGDRLAEAMPKAELARKLLPRRAAALADFHFGWLTQRGILAVAGDRVAPPGRKAQLSTGETGLAAAIVAEYERSRLEPPSPAEVARRLAAKPEIVEGLVRHLTSRGRLIRLPAGLIVAAAAIEELRGELERTGWERFTVPQFKDKFGLSRKWAIPLLEHLDSKGATRRAGDVRLVVRRVVSPEGAP
jgi:selenocysteine-specific elongation factor